VISIGLTLVLQTLSVMSFTVAVEVTEAPGNQVSQLSSSSVPLGRAVNHDARAVAGIGKAVPMNRKAAEAAALIAAIVILLFVIGAGYVFTALELSFSSHFVALSAGVGLVEEFTKAIAGVVIFYWVIRRLPNGDAQGHKKRVMAAFGLAGLGFGAGEALHYFGVYNDIGSGISCYAIRAVWCVALHGCWAMISGAIVASWLPAVWDRSIGVRKASGVILASCIPSVILHGFYDAACIHESSLCWVTGIVSIVAAYVIFESVFDQDAPQVSP
jgi:RsiW-degrading membrane proteinase PrsW (M82 family)